MNNQILKAACSLMLMCWTPIFLVRGCFMGPNSFFNFSHEGMTLENLEMSGDKWLFVFDRGVVISPTITDGYAYIYPGGKMTGGEISGNAELSF